MEFLEGLSQKNDVLEHLKKNGSITSMEAIKKFGATRLSAIIYDLRYRDGYDIVTHMMEGTNRYGKTSRYAKYVLRENDE